MALIESIGGGIGQRGTFGKFTLTGDKELERLLRKLPDKIQTRVLKNAIRFAGKRIVKFQRANAKAAILGGTAGRSKKKQAAAKAAGATTAGTLVKSIGTRLKTYRSDGNTVLIIGPRKGFVAENGERADKYAIGIEFGWRNRVPKPFMRKSFAQGKPTILGDFKTGIGNGIEKEAAKLAKKR